MILGILYQTLFLSTKEGRQGEKITWKILKRKIRGFKNYVNFDTIYRDRRAGSNGNEARLMEYKIQNSNDINSKLGKF